MAGERGDIASRPVVVEGVRRVKLSGFQPHDSHFVVDVVAGGFKGEDARLTAQLNVNNLFDTNHFAGSDAFNSAMFGTPRFFMGSIRMEF